MLRPWQRRSTEHRAGGLLGGWAKTLERALAPRAYSVIVFGALLCNLAAKLFHAGRYGLLREYPSWICTDIAVLVLVEAALALICLWAADQRRDSRGARLRGGGVHVVRDERGLADPDGNADPADGTLAAGPRSARYLLDHPRQPGANAGCGRGLAGAQRSGAGLVFPGPGQGGPARVQRKAFPRPDCRLAGGSVGGSGVRRGGIEPGVDAGGGGGPAVQLPVAGGPGVRPAGISPRGTQRFQKRDAGLAPIQ